MRHLPYSLNHDYVVTPENEHFYCGEMDQAYRLCHKVFVEEMGWKNMAKPDGREIDQFDTKHAVNMLYIEGGKVLGYQRLLPSTRLHFMPELYEVGAAYLKNFAPLCGAGPSLRRAIRDIEPMGVLPLIQLHFQPMPLGPPKIVNGKVVMALTLTFDGRTLERLREMRSTRSRALVETLERPALLHA